MPRTGLHRSRSQDVFAFAVSSNKLTSPVRRGIPYETSILEQLDVVATAGPRFGGQQLARADMPCRMPRSPPHPTGSPRPEAGVSDPPPSPCHSWMKVTYFHARVSNQSEKQKKARARGQPIFPARGPLRLLSSADPPERHLSLRPLTSMIYQVPPGLESLNGVMSLCAGPPDKTRTKSPERIINVRPRAKPGIWIHCRLCGPEQVTSPLCASVSSWAPGSASYSPTASSQERSFERKTQGRPSAQESGPCAPYPAPAPTSPVCRRPQRPPRPLSVSSIGERLGGRANKELVN